MALTADGQVIISTADHLAKVIDADKLVCYSGATPG